MKPTYNPGKGVRTDYEALLKRFTETDSVRYDEFSAIWRDMKFSQIYAGRQDEGELQDFIDECLKIALKFYLPPYSFQIRVGGLYILFGIYSIQPIIRKRKIRVTSDTWNQILEFQNEAHLQEHLDVEFIFHKLRYYDAFEFCATESHVYPNKSDTVVDDSSTREEFKEEQSMLYDLFSTDVLEQLAAVHQHYHHMKVAMENQKNIAHGENETDMPAKSLDVIQQDLVPSITKALITYQEKRKANLHPRKHATETESDGERDEDYSVFLHLGEGTSRQSSVKTRAYKKLAKPSRSRRHRQTQEDTSETEESPQKRRRKIYATVQSRKKELELESSQNEDENEVKDESVNDDEDDGSFLLSMPTLTEEEPIRMADTAKSGKSAKKGNKTKGEKATKSKPRPQVSAELESQPPKFKVKFKKERRGPGRPRKTTDKA
ncbi:snRNA-activating protein complex subunit 1-like [Saccostrea echinata]|uniref:snRNA-activating protein complex subunit 1-like n=1 Tax=Saccostrea echinata TaxID=191078 RepID=UPI002A7FC10B|nr:snRNA-activating protein complex subunit 1-like [Saccostrea echinata]